MLDPAETVAATPSLHGQTIGFPLDALAALPAGRPVLVDHFGSTPRDVAPLPSWPGQAVFLVPTPDFAATTRPPATPIRTGRALDNRLRRDALRDAEIRRQARVHGLEVTTVDGSRPPENLAGEVAERFRICCRERLARAVPRPA